jgi:protein gp37
MPTETAIGWTDYSSNPIKYRDKATGKVVWACVQAADECRNCYAQTLAARWNKGHPFTRPNLAKVEPFLDEKEMDTLARSQKITGKRVFICDMTDACGDWVPDEWLDKLFALFAWRQDVTWQLLTKRPKRLADWFAERFQEPAIKGGAVWVGRSSRVFEAMQDAGYADPENPSHWDEHGGYKWPGWPLPNVHLGTSAGSQKTADLLIPELLRINAAVLWVSVEPLIAPISLMPYLLPPAHRGAVQVGLGCAGIWRQTYWQCDDPAHYLPGVVEWVVVGGESGAGHREMDPSWLESVVTECLAAGVPVYVKQDSGQWPGKQGRITDAIWAHKQMPRERVTA